MTHWREDNWEQRVDENREWKHRPSLEAGADMMLESILELGGVETWEEFEQKHLDVVEESLLEQFDKERLKHSL